MFKMSADEYWKLTVHEFNNLCEYHGEREEMRHRDMRASAWMAAYCASAAPSWDEFVVRNGEAPEVTDEKMKELRDDWAEATAGMLTIDQYNVKVEGDDVRLSSK